jgi:hypothetical protein
MRYSHLANETLLARLKPERPSSPTSTSDHPQLAHPWLTPGMGSFPIFIGRTAYHQLRCEGSIALRLECSQRHTLTGLLLGVGVSEYAIGAATIRFEQAEKNYHTIRRRYHDRASDRASSFLSRFTATFSNVPAIPQTLQQIVAEELERASDQAVRDLIEAGIPYIDDDEFLSIHCNSNLTWSQEIGPIVTEYNKIIIEHGEEAAQVTAPAIFGGGFGLEGAARGIVVASAANAVLGMLNSASLGLKEREAQRTIASLVNSEKSRELIAKGVFNLTFAMHRTVCEIITRLGSMSLKVISLDDEKRARGLVLNCERGRFAKESEEIHLTEALQLNPFNEHAY